MTQVQWNADKTSGAVISDDDKYRFALYRVWDWTKPWLVYVLLNPSTAGAEVNDPTSRVCVGRAKKLGYGGIIMVNLFAWRETDSRLLGATRLGYGNERIVKDLVGADNDRYIVDAAHGDVWTTPSSKRLVVVTTIICAWGAQGSLDGRGEAVKKLLRKYGAKLYYIELTKDQQPCHPLRKSYSKALVRWL